MKTIGIIGTRRRNSQADFDAIKAAFEAVYQPGDTICSGLCPKGGDRFAVVLASEFNTPTLWFPANWKKFGRSAGLIRNTDIAKHSDILIACVAPDRTGGTEDTIRKFLKMGKEDLIIVGETKRKEEKCHESRTDKTDP